MTLHVVVLAGGSGTRLWPLSRRGVPKHLLPIGPGGKTLLRTTVERVRDLGESVHVVTVAAQAQQCLDALDGLAGADSIIAEPVARGTGPALGLATRWLAGDDPDAVVCSVHADAHVVDGDAYRAALAAVAGWANSTRGLATVGIVPAYASTGLGYVAAGEARDPSEWTPPPGALAAATGLCEEARAVPAYRSPGFVEKPPQEVAERFVAEGSHLWNSGIFGWNAGAFLGEIAAASPETASGLEEVVAARRAGDEDAAAAHYATLPAAAVDPLVFERTRTLTVVRGAFAWSDVGSWADLAAVRREGGEGDADGNVVDGDAIVTGSHGCHVVARGGRTVVVSGAGGMVVVDTGDAVLVVPADRAQTVKEVTELLRERGREDLL